MSFRNKLIPLFIISMVFLANQNAMAGKVYQWTDEEGVVHFSDIAPADQVPAEVQVIDLVSYAESDVDTDEYSIVNQLERMAERRRQNTEERLAIKKVQLEEQRLAQEMDSRQYNVISAPVYNPFAYTYAYSQPYIYYQRRNFHKNNFHKNPGYNSNPSNRVDQGQFSTGHLQSGKHYSKIGLQF